MVYIIGRMEGNIQALGLIIKWMGKGYSLGMMGENMKDSLFLIRKKVMVYFIGLMGSYMMGNGKMESNMGSVYIHLYKEKLNKAIGRMEKGLIGLNRIKKLIIKEFKIII